jgi:uncharacterized protein (DUF2062 family)
MPRKFFRKYLPSHDSVKEHRFIRIFGPVLHHPNLWHLNRASVAGGVAVGAFTGMIPGPIQMISAALLAILFRVNLPVAVATTWYTNPVTGVPIYYAAYRIGALITGSGGGPMPNLDYDRDTGSILDAIPAFLQWMGALGEPFLVGVLVLASALSVAGYFLVRLGWRIYVLAYWHERRRRPRRPGKPDQP